MKKTVIIASCYATLTFGIIMLLLLTHPFSTSIEASTISQLKSLQSLEATSSNISLQIDTLQNNLVGYEKSLNDFEKRLSQVEAHTSDLEIVLVDYYLDKLKDPTYISIYNEEYIYYTAAENLGQIGKAAIPKLIHLLNTPDDYERALALYALLLASQADNVKAFCSNDFIDVSLDFDARNHPQNIKTALDWWERYKAYF